MRVCVLVPHYPVRSETFIVDHVSAMEACGHSVSVIPLADDRLLAVLRATKSWRAARSFLDDTTITAPLAFGKRRRLLTIARALENGPFDVLHVQFGTALSVGVALVRHGIIDAPIVCSIHGQDANVRAQADPPAFAALAEQAAALTTGTGFMQTVVEGLGVPGAKIRRWPQGVAVYRPAVERREGALEDLRVVSVGRLVEFKGMDDSLRVIATARATVPGITFTVIGDGGLREPLEALARELGIDDIVTFAGAKDHEDVLKSHADADVYLQMGKVGADGSREGQGVTPLEAAVSGLPCVLANAGGLPEVVRTNETGFLVASGDIAAGAAAITRLANDGALRLRMGDAGRKFASDEYSLAASAARIEAIYAEAIASRADG